MFFEINKDLQEKLLCETGTFIEAGQYNINPNNFLIESPASMRGVNLRESFKFDLGAFTHINPNGFIQNCTIGRYCAIGTGVKIGNGNHPTNWLSVNACQYIKNFYNYNNIFENKICLKEFTPYKHTVIGNDVWIGTNVFIKDGVAIGDGAVIGANSVVTHDVEPYSVVAGSPARLIRYRFTPEIIKELQEIKWWEYNITEFGEIDFDDIEKAIEQLKIKLPTLKKYKGKILGFEYLLSQVPTKKQFFGLLKTYKRYGYKEKYFCGMRIYRKKIS